MGYKPAGGNFLRSQVSNGASAYPASQPFRAIQQRGSARILQGDGLNLALLGDTARGSEAPDFFSGEDQDMSTSPPPQPPAGWYPDPNGEPGQKYWDGQAWADIPAPDIPATPESDIAGTPKPAQPAVSTKGPSGQRKVGFAIAIVLVVLVVVAINRIGIPFWQHSIYPRFFEKGSSSSSSPSSQSPSSQSPSYQEGYNSGTFGLARKGYGDDMYNTGATIAEMEHNACSRAINNEPNYSSLLEPAAQDDYMNGCLKAFGDHPPTAKPKPGPLNPYR